MKKHFLKIISYLTIIVTVFSAFSCGKSGNDEVVVGGEMKLLKDITLDYDNAFFDDFTGGVSYDSWYINKQAWGNGNGGVIPENVNYTDDGVLILSGNGEYYTSGDVRGVGARKDGTLTGAAITSKFITGPGRYQIKMKVLPRLGACSAFWVYAYDKASGGNHEIDIELPGGKSSSMITFQNVLNTNYITEKMNNSQDVAVKGDNAQTVALNDGEWHTFGFDWYTCESGENADELGENSNLGKVVYYLDGKVTAISDFFIPYYQTRLWIGVWFPNNESFVGNADFESDCMYVDWVQYIPFKNQPCVEYNPELGKNQVAEEREYPASPVATTSVNKVANGDFEYFRKKAENNGFSVRLDTISSADEKIIKKRFEDEILALNPDIDQTELKQAVKEKYKEYYALPVTDFYELGLDLGYEQSCGVKLCDFAFLRQRIDSVYSGFKTSVSFKAKGQGKLILCFMKAGQNGRNSAISQLVIEVNSNEWDTFSSSMLAPDGTDEVWIDFVAGLDKTLYVDDISLKLF